jgi:hypothetical protein
MYIQQADAIDNTEPFYSGVHRAWFFYDETMEQMGPYKSFEIAKKAMDDYGYYLNHGPTLWQRICQFVRYGRAVRV